jgi:hypothetical protein
LLAESHIVSAYYVLQQQHPSANVVVTPCLKMMGDLTPPKSTGPGPDIAADTQTVRKHRVQIMAHWVQQTLVDLYACRSNEAKCSKYQERISKKSMSPTVSDDGAE